jgi:hypothetical protein
VTLKSGSEMLQMKKITDAFSTLFLGAAENNDFGNLGILNSYAGNKKKKRIMGRLMHGWAYEEPITMTYYKNNFFKTFVWTSKAQSVADKLMWKNFIAIGAPWLYLTSQIEKNGWPVSSEMKIPGSELWIFANHANLPDVIQKEALLEFLSAAISSDSSNRIVLLSHFDFIYFQSFLKDEFKDLKVITLGERRFTLQAESHLYNLFQLICRAQIVVLDCPTTALLYAGHLECKIRWFKGLHFLAIQEQLKTYQNDKLVEYMKMESLEGPSFKNYCLEQLGVESQKSCEELRNIFGWNSRLGFFRNHSKYLFSTFIGFPKAIITRRPNSVAEYRN